MYNLILINLYNYLIIQFKLLIILSLKICFLVNKNICWVYIRFAYNKKVIIKMKACKIFFKRHAIFENQFNYIDIDI